MNIVKKTKTPAQDRLKNIMAKTKEIDVSIKKEIEAICNEAKTQLKSKPIKSVQAKQERPPESLSSVVKTNVQVSVRAAANKECDSSAFNPIAVKHKRNRLSATSNKQNKITKTKCSKHKTPAQQRLVDLQKTLLKEQLISKNPGERAPQCSNTVNKLHEPSANALDESKDLTHSGLEVGLIDVDIELTLTQNRKCIPFGWSVKLCDMFLISFLIRSDRKKYECRRDRWRWTNGVGAMCSNQAGYWVFRDDFESGRSSVCRTRYKHFSQLTDLHQGRYRKRYIHSSLSPCFQSSFLFSLF